MRAELSGGARPSSVEAHEEPDAREALGRAIAKAKARVLRRASAIRADLARIEEAGTLADRARPFVAEAARAPRGCSKLTTVDWSSGEGVTVEMPLDPARSARQQVDAIFRRARRLKEGGSVARARLGETEKILAGLDALAATLHAETALDVALLAEQAVALAPRDFMRPPRPAAEGRRRKANEPLPPYRTFLGPSGAKILVGRGAAHNDALTLHVARPHHLWLHARGHSGAHVVVPLAKGTSCPSEVLIEAAHLAAHFSAARDESQVEITYVERRHVRKPRGSPPGLVVVTREKTLVLRRSSQLIGRLLDRELAS
jgi:predicted ribosome quality control (RQC) complex YloA/Tae2 family protein